MIHLEILVEEVSAEVALALILPRMLRSDVTFKIHPFQGKSDLLGKLPSRLKGYASWMGPDYRILVLIDEDRQNCEQLKSQLESAALQAGLTTRAHASEDGLIQVVNRIAVEELEAWFFGDVAALCEAYPGVPRTLASKSRYRDPDAIAGGTWEALERVLQNAGHHSTGLQKTRAAREISKHMDPSRNRSKSFRQFQSGIQTLIRQQSENDR